MKIEFTSAEVEAIILAHVNIIAPDAKFNSVEPTGYRSMPDGFVVFRKPEQDPAYAAQ
jgi:hypothetical protein